MSGTSVRVISGAIQAFFTVIPFRPARDAFGAHIRVLHLGGVYAHYRPTQPVNPMGYRRFPTARWNYPFLRSVAVERRTSVPVIQEVRSMILRRPYLLAILVTCWFSLALPALSQDADLSAPNAVEEMAAEKEKPFLEETIYIPYDRLKKVFEKEGRGVFLPYEKFQELWKAARGKTQAIEPPERPVDALISEIDNEATIGDQVVDVTATLQIELLGEGWVEVPLRLNNSAIRSARIGEEPARLTFDAKTGHKMLFKKEGKEPKQLELKLEYTRAFTKTPGQSSVAFAAPQAPINRWTIQVPEKGMAVQVEPMIAATETPEGDGEDDTKPSKILAFVGAAPTVRIAWNPKAEGASGLAAFATVQAEHTITIAEGVVRSSNKLDYAIARSTLTELTLAGTSGPEGH